MKNRKRRGPLLLQLDRTRWSFIIFDRLKTRKKINQQQSLMETLWQIIAVVVLFLF
jgi:hypothetical protein